MSGSCGVNVALDEVVNALVNEYGDALAAEIIKRLDLSRFVVVDDGVANSLNLRHSLTVDEGVKTDLCSILSDCISEKVKAELGCDRDNYVVKFEIDHTNDRLVINLKHGETFSVSKDELKAWYRAEIVSGDIVNRSGSTFLDFTKQDGSKVSVNLDELLSRYTTVLDEFRATLDKFKVSLSDLTDKVNALPADLENKLAAINRRVDNNYQTGSTNRAEIVLIEKDIAQLQSQSETNTADIADLKSKEVSAGKLVFDISGNQLGYLVNKP